ncbi:Hypothetical protein AT6N2_L1925 [Agrobacterium tumefaciens]|nr:Hypothetical protein AT6N2_L1925 [Agrobacterium tumefaciens]
MVRLNCLSGRFVPGLRQNAQPVFPAYFCKFSITVACRFQRRNQIVVAAGIGNSNRYGRAIEIRSERHAVDAHALHHVVDMAHHIGQWRIGNVSRIVSQHSHGIVQADETAAFLDGIHLLVGEITGDRSERMRIGMAGDQRLVSGLCHIPEAFFGNMREVDENAEAIAFLHQRKTGIGKTGRGVGRHGIGKRNAMAENIVPAPHRAERAQAGGIKHFQRVEIGADRLAAFHMQHSGEDILCKGLADVGRGTAESPRVSLIEPQRNRRLFHGNIKGRQALQRRSERRVVVPLRVGFLQDQIAGRDIDCADAPGQAPCPRTGRINMAFARAVLEFGHGIGTGLAVAPQSKQHIIMTVKHCMHGKKFQ